MIGTKKTSQNDEAICSELRQKHFSARMLLILIVLLTVAIACTWYVRFKNEAAWLREANNHPANYICSETQKVAPVAGIKLNSHGFAYYLYDPNFLNDDDLELLLETYNADVGAEFKISKEYFLEVCEILRDEGVSNESADFTSFYWFIKWCCGYYNVVFRESELSNEYREPSHTEFVLLRDFYPFSKYDSKGNILLDEESGPRND